MAFDAQSREGRDIAENLLRLHGEMETERANWDTLWERIAELVFPRAQSFTSRQAAGGDLRGERVFDNTPGIAVERHAAAMGAMLTPGSTQWHGLRASNAEYEDEEVREYLEMAARYLFQARYAPKTNFSSQTHEIWLSDSAFGSGCLFIDEEKGSRLRYRSIHLSEVYIGDNHQGGIDRVHRGRFEMKAYQVEQLANHPDPAKRWTMPDCVKKALDGPRASPNTKFEFIHCVYPNEQRNSQYADARGMELTSTYICAQEACVTNSGGYRTMPYAISRYVTGPREVYGRSPIMTVFRDILMLNEMNKTMIRAGQRQVDPPWLLPEEGALQPFQALPGSFNYGYVNDEGRPLVHAMRPEGELAIGLEMIQDRRTAINDALGITLFQVLVDNPDMTATQALLRAQEKGQLLGPTFGRQQSEFLASVIERELDVLSAAGALPPPPEQLIESGGWSIEFKSPYNRLLRADDAVGLIKTIETLTPMAQIDPSVLDVVDIPKSARLIAEAQGAPADALRSEEEIAAIAEQKQQRADLEALIKSAPLLGKTARDLSQASATVGNMPRPIPFVEPSTV